MPLAVAVRPEKIQIAKLKPAARQNLFAGKVQDVAYFGSYSTYVVAMGDGQRIKVTATNTMRGDGGNTSAEGDRPASGDTSATGEITGGDAVFFWWDDTAAVTLTQ